jgi:predicted alpha/beta hydrolase
MAKLQNSSVQAEDGFPLAVSYYEPFGNAVHHRVALINAGAGIPRSLYEPFAVWLADNGIPTATYDYRGIGGSRCQSIRGLPVTIRDWGSKDCAAVISAVRDRYPDAGVSIVAHSIGSVVTGFVNQPQVFDRLVFISPHTGHSSEYAPSSRARMLFLWHIVMPAITRLLGYFPGRLFGLPGDLPYGVALEWASRRQANSPEDKESGAFAHIYAECLVIRPADDPFATRIAMDRIERVFSSTRFEERVMEPMGAPIGHWGFFRTRERERFWPEVLAWLCGQSQPAPNNAAANRA